MKFSDLALSPKVLQAVESAGFTEPTPIQESAIPIALEGRDVLGIAQTGTGKTACFALPMLTCLERGRARARMPRSLVLAPTRELAAQVADSFAVLGANHKLTVALLIGGVSFDEQLRKLDRGADVLIATPGRLLDHFERGKLLLSGVEILVIDEADRMLDMGFIPDVERICNLLPPKRQTLFFSATMPPEIKSLVARFLKEPERVEVARQSSVVSTITQHLKYASSHPKDKRAVLRELINAEQVSNAIIFCNRKKDVGILHRSMLKHGYSVGALHGDLDQHQRMATLDAFRKGEITFLVASDVAARGLDIPDVSHVFNFDVPGHAEDYVHRIGRTGRAGKSGTAAMLVTSDDMKRVRAIEQLCRETIPWLGEPPPTGASASDGRGNDDRRRKRGRRTKRGREASGEADAKTSGRKKSGGNAPGSRNANNDRRKSQKAGRGDDAPAKGLGDHVPAFLMRPVRITD